MCHGTFPTSSRSQTLVCYIVDQQASATPTELSGFLKYSGGGESEKREGEGVGGGVGG